MVDCLAQGDDAFTTQLAGMLCVIPYIAKHGIDRIIAESSYSETRAISRVSSILSFAALKLSGIKRYSADDAWCMYRGMGLFAGLNVLPKTAWFSSYSSAITRGMNISFLKSLQSVWADCGLLSNTVNLDFTAIPYWGDDDPFENNWSGKRGRALYGNLSKINNDGIKFITIRRRCQSLVSHINSIDDSKWKNIKVQKSNGKGRQVTVFEETDTLKGYCGVISRFSSKTTARRDRLY